jgi:hypothetical protein
MVSRGNGVGELLNVACQRRRQAVQSTEEEVAPMVSSQILLAKYCCGTCKLKSVHLSLKVGSVAAAHRETVSQLDTKIGLRGDVLVLYVVELCGCFQNTQNEPKESDWGAKRCVLFKLYSGFMV